MCAFSLGTETDGSVTFPASQNGIIGLKPTVGLTSRFGVIPEAPSFDTVGILSRSLQDAAIVLSVIVGVDRHKRQPNSTRHTSSRHNLRGVRMGLPKKRIWDFATRHPTESDEGFSVLYRAIDLIKDAGAELVDVDLPSAEEIIPPEGWDWNFGEPNEREFTVVEKEFNNSLKEYLATLETNPNNIQKLEDIVKFNNENTTSEGGVAGTHPAWPRGQDVFDKCIQSQSRPDSEYNEALSFIRRKSRTEGIDAALLEYNVDALLVPVLADGGSAVSTAAKAGEILFKDERWQVVDLRTGYPMISIPAGVSESTGVPVGLGIAHTAWREKDLVQYGFAIEEAIRGRRKPEFRNWEAQNYPYVGAPSSGDP
ncbi:MAG: hypothetical protein M1831_005430 [Alyxoria varia]|nr:MAG: hypothetical protein M1831_005430 [Alyxoria varia]